MLDLDYQKPLFLIDQINNQSKRTNPASQYSLSQVLSKESSAETSHYAEDDDDIRNESNVLSRMTSLFLQYGSSS